MQKTVNSCLSQQGHPNLMLTQDLANIEVRNCKTVFRCFNIDPKEDSNKFISNLVFAVTKKDNRPHKF